MGVDEKKISRVRSIRTILDKIVKESKLNVITSSFHQFKPFGVSGFYLLRESHLSIHTWPEYSYFTVDIYSCGDERNAFKALNLLIKEFSPKLMKKRIIRYGLYEKARNPKRTG
jgi:S-adenosylmethionine decarboxylase